MIFDFGLLNQKIKINVGKAVLNS